MPTWFDEALDSLGKGLKSTGSQAIDYLTSPEGIVRLGSVGLGYLGNKSGVGEAQIPPSGYQGGIPALTAMRQQVPVARGTELQSGAIRPMGTPAPTGIQTITPRQAITPQPTGRMIPMAYDPNRRPGSGGRRYFTDVEYVAQGADVTPAQQRQDEQIASLMEQNIQNPAREARRGPPAPVQEKLAAGGLATLKMKKGKYLNGDTDGMADDVPAEIEGMQPAALSDGEFVIPADVVSHLGNGNSDAGAKVLESMMARVRKARTGSKKQGKEIDPKKYLPV
jgi:hypothetical protein